MKIDKRLDENPPKFSHICGEIFDAYNSIARSRIYSNSMPLPISNEQIISYLTLNDLPFDLSIFCEAIFMIDSDFINDFKKNIELIRKSAK